MRPLRTLILIVAVTISCACPALADGILIPRPVPGIHSHPEAFSVKYHHVHVTIDNQAATTVIDQVFVNTNDYDLEGTYIFPIPETASITEFGMWMNGEKITGEILGAEEARRIYQDIVRRMKDPGLLEYAGRDMYRARVYPIPKHGEVKIEMSYQELLDYDSGLVSYRYPLNTERFSAANLEHVAITVDIESSVPIKSLYCPSHEVDAQVSGLTASCGYEDEDVKPDRDFFLYYTISEEDLGLNLLTHRIPGDDGYFMLLLSPGALEDKGKVIDKDIIFVIDRSGSMRGEKIEQAKAALEFCLKHLNAGDRFNIITFATQTEMLERELARNTDDNLGAALDFVAEIEAAGSTNIDEALELALDVPPSDNPQIIIFLTDGLPTTGETDVAKILDNVGEQNHAKMRIFPFGVGYDVNTTLLDQLSLDNRGTVEYVKPSEDIEFKVAGLYSKVSKPVLSDISIEFDDVDVSDTYPAYMPDIFSGSQVVLFGRYEDSASTAIRLAGRVGEKRKEFVYEGTFERENAANDFIPPLWATRKIGYLMTEIRLHGENDEIKDEIVRLATEFGIVTPYTSYLVTEKALATMPGVTMRDGALQVTGGRGSPVDMFVRVEASRAPAPGVTSAEMLDATKKAIGAASGRASVGISKRLSADREVSVVTSAESGAIKRVSTKTFYYDESTGWTDSEFTEGMKTTRIEYLSDEYFALLDSHPEVGKYFSLGENVTFVFEGKVYEVVEG